MYRFARAVTGTLVAALLAAAFCLPAWAGPIATRSALDGMLGVGAMGETFESYSVAPGALDVLGSSLSSTTVVNGQGPGLIARGFDITTTTGSLVWQGDTAFNLPTKTFGSQVSFDVTIDFTTFVSAAGLDVMNYGGFPAVNSVTFFGLDDTTVIGTFPGLSFPSAVTPQFVGFANAAGIGSIRVNTDSGFGPVIDNLAFGTPGWIDQRSTLDALLGTGAVNEPFETYAVGTNTSSVLGNSVDSTTTVNGQGPGLLVPDVTVSTSAGGLIWQGDGFFNIPTKTMGSLTSFDLAVDFARPMKAFGVDVLNYDGFPSVNDLTVFGPDGTTVIGSFLGLTFDATGSSHFMGFENAAGIGGFRIDMFQGFGPVVDNLAFAQQASEPAALALFGLALAGLGVTRRRKAALTGR